MILLASKSPRRQELLKQIGLEFSLLDVEIDETILPKEDARTYVKRMAYSKAIAAQQKSNDPHFPILGADTIVVTNNKILGKPRDFSHFNEMVSLLSDSKHQVYSAFCLLYHDRKIIRTNISCVNFSTIPQEFITLYWNSKEPQDKAGGYAIQGMMAQYINKIEGSYSGIMGLPLFELSEALREIKYNNPFIIST